MSKEESYHHEDVVSRDLAELLRGQLPEWTIRTKQKAFEGNSREADIFLTRSGHETIVIEAKSYDVKAEAAVTSLRERYLGQELDTNQNEGVSNDLCVGLAVRYTEAIQCCAEETDIQQMLVLADDIEYRLITSDNRGNFPTEGFAKGTIGDIADALYRGATPVKKIEAAVKRYKQGIKRSVREIQLAIKDTPRIGATLAKILGQEATKEACGTACIFIVDAFIFQDKVAGKEEFKNVEKLSYWDNRVIRWDSIVKNWHEILKINYVPIFRTANRIVKLALREDVNMAHKVLRELMETASEIVRQNLSLNHQLGGEIFQEFVEDREYVKANYTLPESAALLSALVCPDIDENNLPTVADFACGTGALINGVYKRIQRLYEKKTGRSSAEIHRTMLHEKLFGADIFSHATHMTFTAMAAAHPEITLGATCVHTAPIGYQDGYGYLTGSLDLLTEDLLLPGLGFDSEVLDGEEEEATADMHRDMPHNSMDIVIINPPFSRSADQSTQKAKSAFKGKKREEEEEKILRAEVKKKDIRVGNGSNGLGSYFVDLADRKLKKGGTMGFILLSTILTGASMNKVRRMLAEEYHDVIVVTISANSGTDSAFSADTSLAECIVVATKGKKDIGKNTGRARFVCLTARPNMLLSAQKLAGEIRRMPTTRRIEDAPHGGDELFIGGEVAAHVLDSPIDENEWAVGQVKSLSLMQMAYHLLHGKLQFPSTFTSRALPMCQIQDIGKFNLDTKRIKDERQDQGAFRVREGASDNSETYPMLGKAVSKMQRAMQTVVNANGRIRAGKEEQAYEILSLNSRTHYYMYPSFTSTSQLASFTENPSVGVSFLCNVQLVDSQYESAWTLWTNSTFGMFCHWMHSSKPQVVRGLVSWTTRNTVPTLDVRELSDAQLAAADRIFAELKDVRMLPYNECANDPWRHILDARLLAEVLGITDKETHDAMQKLREMLCAEPTIAGTKKSTCALEKEAPKHAGETDEALLAQQARLKAEYGIEMPAVKTEEADEEAQEAKPAPSAPKRTTKRRAGADKPPTPHIIKFNPQIPS